MARMFGIDTSHWKADINLANVSCDFVYTKATEGNYYVDDACDKIVQQAVKLGKKWGVYHFATNTQTNAITEANYFVDNCLGYIGKGMLILDNEAYTWSNGVKANDPYNVAWCKQWLDQVYKRTGVKPLIYMSASVVRGADWSSVINGDYGLIVAAYPLNNTPINQYNIDLSLDPNPKWGTVGNVMWQFTSTGRLSGYSGNLDCNVFYGSTAAWDAYAKVKTTEPVKPQPVIETKTVTETKEIEFSKVTVSDDKLEKGKTEITQEGKNGVRTITYTVTLTDGVETNRVQVSDVVTTGPTTQITTIGTYVKPEPQPDDPVPEPKPESSKDNWLVALIKKILAFFKIKV